VRPGSLAVIALVCALLGASTALVVAKAAGWVGDDGATRTVVLTAPGSATPAANSIDEDAAAKPLPGNDFDPAAIYRERAAGVVTILALFGPNDSVAAADAAQGSGFVVSSEGYILTNSHVITTAGEDPTAAPESANTVFVEFRDGDRVRARVVGWDIYDDVGLLKVDPGDHHLTVVPLGDSTHVVVGQPVAAIGSPFGNESSLSVGVVSAT
jgi:S1-C subfamily serine protease